MPHLYYSSSVIRVTSWRSSASPKPIYKLCVDSIKWIEFPSELFPQSTQTSKVFRDDDYRSTPITLPFPLFLLIDTLWIAVKRYLLAYFNVWSWGLFPLTRYVAYKWVALLGWQGNNSQSFQLDRPYWSGNSPFHLITSSTTSTMMIPLFGLLLAFYFRSLYCYQPA